MELRKIFPVLILSLAFVVGNGCDSEDAAVEAILYEGPMQEGDSILTLYSDSAIVRVMVKAPKQLLFEDGDQEFPEGIYIQFFEPDGSVTSTLKADHGYLFQDEKRYTGVGNIIVESLKDKNKLLTDTLHWSQAEAKFYTKARVTIIEEADTLRGQGLEASQDFSTYTILKPEGTILSEEPEKNTEGDINENN